MAVVENRFVCDLSKPVQAQALKGNVFSLDNLGSRLSVLIYNNGQPATISGSITANCILPDGSTVNVNGGLTTEGDGSKAYVDVPQSCLLIPGILKIAIKCTLSSVITTLAAIVANVYMTKTDNVITPSQQIITDWNAEISASLANQDAEISDLKSALNANLMTEDELTFVQGGLDSYAGTENTSATNIRTFIYNTAEVECGSGYSAKLFAYNGTTFVGAWTGSEWSTNYLVQQWLAHIDIASIREKYAAYNYRLCIKKNSGDSIAPSDASNCTFRKVRYDDTLTKSLYFADAKVTGDNFSSVRSALVDKLSTRKLGGQWTEFSYPNGFLGTFKPVKIFTDGRYWKTDFNKEDWKVTNSDPKTYYVGLDGTYLNDGLSREKPITIYNAISRASSGDTIIIMEGDYRNDTVTNAAIPSITKSLNIIGEGKVRVSKSSKKTVTYDSTKQLYKVTQNAMQGAYDPELDLYFATVETIEDCQNTPFSLCFADAPTVYLNTPYSHDIIAVYNDIGFVIDNTSADIQVYFENIEFMGGGCPFKTSTSSLHSCMVICDSCTFSYNVGALDGVCKIISAKAIMNKCVTRFSQNDGFSYSVSEGGAATGFIEIDCEGHHNGFNLSSDSSNGSTAHSGICGIRVNGIYHDNKGGNVADVQSGTCTINCGCLAFDSVASQDGYNEGFGLQQAGAKMWLYNCSAFGNFYDFYGVPDTEMTAYKSCHITNNYEYDYSGTLVDTKPKTLGEVNMENTAMIIHQLN